MYAYNPRKKSYQQLEKSMVGNDRWDILNSILKEMNIKKNEGPKQHWMIIGPRGIGKSHLMTLLYHKVKDNQKLSNKWTPILFPEELKLAGTLHKILERALNEIILEIQQKEKEKSITAELKQRIKDIKSVPSPERVNSFFDLISWFFNETGKHTLLIAENLQQLLGKKIPVIEQKKLRAFLQTSDALLIIGSATTVFNALHDHSHPFYHFFHIRRLEDLGFEDMKTLVLDNLSQRQQPGLKSKVTNGNARLKALYSFTGGNPRMAVFLADILSTEVPGEMLELMDSILDELTPYFESILQGIADCFEEVINTLAAFEPAQSPSEIAKHLEMPQASIRNYLKQLKEDGHVRIAFSKGKSNYYCLNEYLYRIWYQMRDSSHREESRWLIEFLLMIYSREAIVSEKSRLEACADVSQTQFLYKKFIDQAVKFIDSYPDYCKVKVIEWCVDSIKTDNKRAPKVGNKERKMIGEAFRYVENEGYDKAIKVCNEILENNPNSGRAYLTIGLCLCLEKQYGKAIEKFKKGIELNPESDRGYWGWGECLREQGLYKKAIEKFKKVIELNPESDEGYWSYGECFWHLGQFEEAIGKFKKIIELNPKSERCYGMWGECLTRLYKWKEAIEKFEKVIDINPKSEPGYIRLGECLNVIGRYKEAIKIFKKAIEINPKSEECYFSFGECLRWQGKYDEAIEIFIKGLEINSNSVSTYLSLGECFRELGQYGKAVKNYKKLTEIKPDFEIGYWLWGECLKKNGQHFEAIALYEKHITDSRDSFGIHSYGKCLMEVERYDEALKQFERLIDIQPEYNPVYLSYGQILEIKGDKENALLAYLKHIKLAYEDSAGKFNFKKIYKQHVIPLLNKLESKGYVKQFYGSENKKISDIQLSIILILLSKYDVVNEHIQNTIKVNLGKTDEKKKEFEILIFTIKLSSWLKLIDENFNDALKSTDLYIEYIKALKTIKERENEVMNFSLDLFSIQIKYNIKTENVRNVLKRLEDVEEIPFSNVIFKVWTCLSDPDSVEAQRYLNEKPIAEVVKQLKERVKSQKRDKNHCKDNVK